MKNYVFFMTHNPLDKNFAAMTFNSMATQWDGDGFPKKFDALYLYNTHEHEVPNDYLLNLYDLYGLRKWFETVEVFPYDPNTPKHLCGDVGAVRDFAVANFQPEDRVLLMKSDIVLSRRYFDTILSIPEEQKSVYFTAPFVNAKARVSDAEIFEYSLREKYIPSDEITFLVESHVGNGRNDFQDRPGTDIKDWNFKFGSCYVISDFTCHFISVNLLPLLSLNVDQKPWGSDAYVRFYSLYPYFVGTDRCFTVHKYHSVINERRIVEREGPSGLWWIS